MKNSTAIEHRRSEDRGRFVNEWLDARFSFSFGNYRDPARDRFGALRALNEDVIQPRTGFAMHPHRDLDIFILPLAGEVEHRDSQGRHAQVRPGQVQWMHAGSGISHSQMNASETQLDHHLQVWFDVASPGGSPHVEARDFRIFEPSGRWRPIVSPDGAGGSFAVGHRTWWQSTMLLVPGDGARHVPRPDTQFYVHVATGAASARMPDGSVTLRTADALAVRAPITLELKAVEPSTLVLVFEFPAER